MANNAGADGLAKVFRGDDVRELLPPDVSYETEGLDEDDKNKEGIAYNSSTESSPTERMRQDVVEEEGLPDQG